MRNIKKFEFTFIFQFQLLLNFISSHFHIYFIFISTEGLVSYAVPKANQKVDIELSDRTYDGDDQGDRLVNGMGQLVDGQKGQDNYRADVNGFGRGE